MTVINLKTRRPVTPQDDRLADITREPVRSDIWDEAPAPATEQYDYWDENERGTYRLSTGQFLLAAIVVCMGALAFVL